MSIARFHFMNILSENLSQVFRVFSIAFFIFLQKFSFYHKFEKKSCFFYGQKFLYKFEEKESCKE